MARHGSRRLATLLALAAATCVMAVGCGGDDDTSASVDLTSEPSSYQAFAEQVAGVLADADDRQGCKRIRTINARSLEELPCPAPEAVRDRMGSFELVDKATFASDRVGIVDYEPAESGLSDTMVLLRDYANHWTVTRFGLDPELAPANGRGDGDGNIRRAMMRYERAVRERDCEQLGRLVYRPAGTDRPGCREQLAETRRLMRVLRADPGQRPAYLGGNDRFGAYGLTAFGLGDRTHHTFTVIKSPIAGEDRYLVLDVVQDEPMLKPS